MNQTMSMVLWFVVIIGLMYFFVIRPNKKQQDERRTLVESVKARDRVVTIGGLHGMVSKVKSETVFIKVAPNVELEFAKGAIQTIKDRDYKADRARELEEELELVEEEDDDLLLDEPEDGEEGTENDSVYAADYEKK